MPVTEGCRERAIVVASKLSCQSKLERFNVGLVNKRGRRDLTITAAAQHLFMGTTK
jgi:hypothetical protein